MGPTSSIGNLGLILHECGSLKSESNNCRLVGYWSLWKPSFCSGPGLPLVSQSGVGMRWVWRQEEPPSAPAWFLGAVGLLPRCSWRTELLPRKAVLPAAHSLCGRASLVCACMRVCAFYVCVRERETDKVAECEWEIIPSQGTSNLRECPQGHGFRFPTWHQHIWNAAQVVLMSSQAWELLFQTLCAGSPTPAPLSHVLHSYASPPTELLATSTVREEGSPWFLETLGHSCLPTNEPTFLEDIVGWLNKFP